MSNPNRCLYLGLAAWPIHPCGQRGISKQPCRGTNPNIHAVCNMSEDTTTQKVSSDNVLLPQSSRGHESIIILLEHLALGSCLNQKFTSLKGVGSPSGHNFQLRTWAVPSRTEVNHDPQCWPLHSAFLYSFQSILKFVISWNSHKTLSGSQIEKS